MAEVLAAKERVDPGHSLACSLSPIRGWIYLLGSARMSRHELLVPLARLYLGRRPVVFLAGALAGYSFLALGVAWLSYSLLVARGGNPSLLGNLSPGGRDFAVHVLMPFFRVETFWFLLLGILLRRFLRSRFVRSELLATRLAQDDLLRLIIFVLAVLVGLAILSGRVAVVLHQSAQDGWKGWQFFTMLLGQNSIALGSNNEFAWGPALAFGAWNAVSGILRGLVVGLPVAFIICWPRRLADGLLCGWFLAGMLDFRYWLSYPLNLLLNPPKFITPQDYKHPWNIVWELPRHSAHLICGVILLGIWVQFIRTRFYPRLMNRIPS